MLSALIAPVTGLLDKFIEDKDQKNALAHEIATMSEKHAQQLAIAQIEVNKAEAARGGFAGLWRPLMGFVCVFAFAWSYVLMPFILFFAALFGVEIPSGLPEVDTATMMPILLGMLGLATNRTAEKIKGVART
jgi:hypothetical protein